MATISALSGKGGAGPGEFRRPVRGGWLGDTLWISDTDPGRVTLISPALQVLRTLPPLVAARPRPEDRERLPTFSFVFPYGLYRDGVVLAVAMGSAGDPLADAFKGLALIRVDSTAQVERLVLETPENEGSINVRYDGGIASVLVRFFARPSWSVSPDGAVVAVVTNAIDSVSVAANARLVAASAGHAWGLEEDDGVQSIVRYGAPRTLHDGGSSE